MNRHLNDKELSGYIHQTLTDAQRESMDRHLDACPRCREQVAEAKAVQRRIHYGLTADLRQVHPTKMQFRQIAPNLLRKRRWARVRFYSMQTLSSIALLAVVVAVTTLIIAFIQSPEWRPTSSVPSVSTVLGQKWDDANLYRQGLILSERSAVKQLDNAPIYHMALTIPSGLDMVRGQQEVRYTNHTGRPLDEIYFQLTPNLTSNQLTVSRVTVNGRSVVVTPTQDNKPSLLRIALNETMLPNEQAVIYMAFQLEMGSTRTALNGTLGLIDGVLTLSNFHPTVAVFREDKWQLDQPMHGIAVPPENSFYLVKVTSPNNLPIIASGLEIGRDVVGSQQTLTFAAGPIGQFYLTASERYTVALSEMVGDTKVTSYAYAEHLNGQARTALDFAVVALEDLNERYGIYPFTRLQIVGIPSLGVPQTGIAYPGVILTDLNQYETVNNFGKRSLESAVVFGVTQQWFGRILGPNRLKNPWLAESIGELLTQTIITDLYGKETAAKLQINYLSVRDRAYTVPIGLSAYSYTLNDYLATMYGRGPDFLYIVSHTIDTDVWETILRDYYQTYKWDGRSPPTTESFRQLAEKHCDCNLQVLFSDWVERKNK
jgi:hypothetical protein